MISHTNVTIDMSGAHQVIVGLHVVAHSFHGEDNLRLDLHKPVEHAGHTKVRRGRAPNGPDGSGGGHGLNGQRAVGEVPDDLQIPQPAYNKMSILSRNVVTHPVALRDSKLP